MNRPTAGPGPVRGLPGRGATAALALALVITTLAVFWPVVDNGFLHYDDKLYVTGNPPVLSGLTAPGIAWAFTSFKYAANWHPLTWISHMLDVEIFGLAPYGHHLVNALLHALNGGLLFLVLRGMTGASWPSLAAAALFALHPLHVESVAWIAERKDVLSTFFWFLAMAAYTRYARAPGLSRFLPVAAALLLGLLAKPMLVTLPFVLLLMDLWPLGRLRGFAPPPAAGGPPPLPPQPLSRLVLEKIPLFALSAASSVITYLGQRHGGALDVRMALPDRLANAVTSYLAYIVKMLWPVDLTVHYPFAGSGPSRAALLAAAVVLGLVSLAVLRQVRRRPYLAVGWLWYLGTLVPVIGLVQVGNQSMADRYTYVPLTGLFIMLAWGFADLTARRRHRKPLAAAVALALFFSLTAATRAQIGLWRDDLTLFGHAIATTEGNWVAHMLVGDALYRDGRPGEAEGHYREAVRFGPENPVAHNNLGNALDDLGRRSEALRHYREAVRLNPAVAGYHYNLALVLEKLGRFPEAGRHYREALRLDPDDARTRRRLENLRR